MMDRFSSNVKQNPWLASLGAGAMGAGAGSMLGGYKDPTKAANPFYEQIKQMLPQYFNPSIEAGNKGRELSQGAYGEMLDPNALIKKIGTGYQESPGYQFQKQQGLDAATNAAASGGMLGTPQHQQQAATMAGNLANQDFYSYLERALGQYGQGAQGEQHLSDIGGEGSMDLGQLLASILNTQGGLAYKGAQEKNQGNADIFGNLMSGASAMLPMLFA
jgi:hypothetical protein